MKKATKKSKFQKNFQTTSEHCLEQNFTNETRDSKTPYCLK